MEQSQQPQVQQPLPNATMILVLGILSIVICFITGIIALVMAKKETELYNNNPGVYSESSFSSVKAGKICSIIGLILWAVGILVYIAIIAFFVTAAGASGGFN
jgi:uncharacterized membrane protein